MPNPVRMSLEPVMYVGKPVQAGTVLYVEDGYTVTYVGVRPTETGREIVMRDCHGEFAKPVPSIPDHIILSSN